MLNKPCSEIEHRTERQTPMEIGVTQISYCIKDTVLSNEIILNLITMKMRCFCAYAQ